MAILVFGSANIDISVNVEGCPGWVRPNMGLIIGSVSEVRAESGRGGE